MIQGTWIFDKMICVITSPDRGVAISRLGRELFALRVSSAIGLVWHRPHYDKLFFIS